MLPYPEEQLLAIIERYARGENLLDILKEGNMPDWATFYRRCCDEKNAPEHLRIAYERAQVSWATRAVHEVPSIADNVELGEELTVSDGPKGVTTTRKTVDRIAHRALRVSTRQWFASRLLQKLADKQILQNPDGSPVFQPVINMTVVRPKE
jgi:hypothetical protein